MVQCLRSVDPLSHLFRGGGSFFHIIFKGSSLNSLILTLLHFSDLEEFHTQSSHSLLYTVYRARASHHIPSGVVLNIR